MIKVPFMKMPSSCEHCPFAKLKYRRSLTDGVRRWNCLVEYYEKGKYETVREAPYNEHVAPVNCPLIDEES